MYSTKQRETNLSKGVWKSANYRLTWISEGRRHFHGSDEKDFELFTCISKLLELTNINIVDNLL